VWGDDIVDRKREKGQKKEEREENGGK